ncbi:1-(5-phosphoribosyl)-5-[(5-phosphoribosylamino) methylideneamino] imidazole-4-carboxamide isomerase [Campylobacterota bacterium]|nr:1-(5-phosphoribosyl)-5-[(5-phosphoribosylamino) methylideneamino] imidazole-4-carboxamide isomerase [Campylobacterota bacterium]
MTIFPAIDLKNNQAVRLSKGLMDTAKVYSANPPDVAKEFENAGAEWLHIVDLDGAFAKTPKNQQSIAAIVQSTNLNIQLGGGIRSEETIKAYLDLGISRVILGSAAAKNPEWAKQMAEKYRVAVGIDAKNGLVAVEGWAEVSRQNGCDLAAQFRGSNVEALICTDIAKDGMLSGVNGEWTRQIKDSFGGFVIASGGVTSLADLTALEALGIDGAIVGKAIYEHKISVKALFNRNLGNL